MRAIVYRKYGGPEKLEVVNIEPPETGRGQILIRVYASSVNPVDYKIASGKLWPFLRARFPQVPGFDIAGEVVRCGRDVHGFMPKMRVHACLAASGASAEYAVSTPSLLVPMPANMNFATGAGLPLAGMTALQGLRDKGGMPLHGAKQRVLIVGASGGVGHLAVQIAVAAGATVIGVCSDRNRTLVDRLGAHQVIDYKAPNPYRQLNPCDLIFDCVGQPFGNWLPYLKPGGRFVTVLPSVAVFLRSLQNVFQSKKVSSVMLNANAADLRILDNLVSGGKLRVIVDKRLPLEELRQGWKHSLSKRTIGKLIIDVINPETN